MTSSSIGQYSLIYFSNKQIHKHRTHDQGPDCNILQLCSAILHVSEHKHPLNIDSFTPMHLAARYGHTSVVQVILYRVKDKNPSNRNGDTPLHFAARHGHLSITKLIVDSVVDKNPFNSGGDTPLHLAARFGHNDVVQYLIDEVEDKNPVKIVYGEDGECYEGGWTTPLHLAAENGHHEGCETFQFPNFCMFKSNQTLIKFFFLLI